MKNHLKNLKNILQETLFNQLFCTMSELDCDIEPTVKHCHTKYSGTQIIESIDGSVSKRELQIPTDEKELKIKFSQEYKEFFKEYWKINYDYNKFITTLKLYYDDQNMVDEFNEIRHKLAHSYLLIKELIETKTVQDFKKYFEWIDKNLDEISLHG